MRGQSSTSASGNSWNVGRPLLIISVQLVLTSCSSSGAPSFTLFGAFFPGWMFCGLTGIIGAAVARAVFVVSGLSNVLPYQLFVCTAIGIIVAILAWFVWFWR
jgi:hypothetical protein